MTEITGQGAGGREDTTKQTSAVPDASHQQAGEYILSIFYTSLFSVSLSFLLFSPKFIW